MLVLTRRTDESIIIGDNIVITVLGVEGEKVKIGIEAPREITVLRQELWQAIHEQEEIARKLVAEENGDRFVQLRQFLAEEADPNPKPETRKSEEGSREDTSSSP